MDVYLYQSELSRETKLIECACVHACACVSICMHDLKDHDLKTELKENHPT